MAFDLQNINTVREIVKQALKYKKSGKALDLGSGIGYHSLYLAKKGFKVVAVDHGSQFVAGLKELARLQKLPIQVIKADVTSYESKTKFDLVLSSMVLHFLPTRVQDKCIELMQKITASGGINVITNYSSKNLKGLRPTLVSGEKLKKRYSDAGWKILFFDEKLSDPKSKNPLMIDGKKVRYWTVDLIVQKP